MVSQANISKKITENKTCVGACHLKGRARLSVQRGIALIELALVAAPLLMISITVIGDFSRIYMLNEQLTAAAEAGALYAYQTWSLQNWPQTIPRAREIELDLQRKSEIRAAVINSVLSSSGKQVFASADLIDVGKTCDCPDGNPLFDPTNPDTTPTPDCDAIDDDSNYLICEGLGQVPIQYIITVSAYFVPITPGLNEMLKGLPKWEGNKGLKLSQTATFRLR